MVVAGLKQTLTLTITIGETELPKGGRIAVYCQKDFGGASQGNTGRLFQGPDGQAGYGSRISASASREDVKLQIKVHSTGSVFTVPEIMVTEGCLAEGDKVTILFGDPECSKPQVVCEKAKHLPFRAAIDYQGDNSFRPINPIPQVRIIGSKAKYLRTFAEAAPGIGEGFNVRVVAADLENHNPSYYHKGKVTLTASSGVLEQNVTAEFVENDHGSLLVKGLKVKDEGVTRIRVIDEDNSLMGVTNPVCPAIAPDGLKIFFGEIHSHTEISDGTGTPEDSYIWARDVEGLDFSALADHFEDGQSYNYTLEDKWQITKDVTEKFNKDHEFVTLLGYEVGTVEAHRNVYFSDGVGRMIVEGKGGETVTMDNVFEKLEGTDYIFIPHAPKFHGINWHRPHNPERQRLVEICSNWGISEEGGPLSVQEALRLGYKFGFTGGTDNHSAEPGNPEFGGITGVFAPALTRKEIFNAIKERRTFATYGPRMSINFTVNGQLMGSDITASPNSKAEISLQALTCEQIAKVEIICNNKVVFSDEKIAGAEDKLNWQDEKTVSELLIERELTGEKTVYYYPRITTVNGDIGWASPVWINIE
jgi:hypothetical protein